MNNEELGLDEALQRDPQRTTVTIDTVEDGNKEQILDLEASPTWSKFSWRASERRAEAEHLAKARKVAGIAKLVGSREFVSIDELRSGLNFSTAKGTKRKRIKLLDAWQPEAANLSFTSRSVELETITISGTKRAGSQAADEGPRTPKKLRSSAVNLTTQFRKPKAPFRNRKLTGLTISPAGRPLRDFRSIVEFLTGMRDAIRAHKALNVEAKILHRDISENNIILTDPTANDGFSGMLIDLDLAVGISDDGRNEQSSAGHMTGTLDFMALEILEGGLDQKTAGIEHTYRHDLESFFYMFLTVCIRYGWEDGKTPGINPLSPWYTGEIENNYRTKRGDMEVGGFEKILMGRFSPTFAELTDLARKLREILFTQGALFTGTPKDPEDIYGPLIGAFNDALQALK